MATVPEVEFLNRILERISDPVILGWALVACFAIWTGPAYIKAIGEFIREGRKNKVDVERKQALLKDEIKAIKDRRLSKNRKELKP